MNTTSSFAGHTPQGYVAPGFERVADVFGSTLHDQYSGAALAVRVDGHIVIDLWGGVADKRDGRVWEASTPSTIFSCTKGLVSILAAHLVSEGRLDYDAQVTTYWPEFGVAGKEHTLIRHLLSHRAGLSAPRRDLTFEDVINWETMVRVLQEQEPIWTPGAGWGYHALTHGWLNGEVIRRITGVNVGDYFQEVLAKPLGAEAWIGLPADHIGTPAHLQVLIPENEPTVVPSPTVGGPVSDQFTDQQWMDRAMTLGGALSGLVSSDKPDFNDPRIQMAQIPGGGGIATARALASIWSSTVVETDGLRLLNDDVIAAATTVQSEGPAVFSSEIPPHPRWGVGFMLNSERRTFLTPKSFGHDGAGGQVGFADPINRVGFGYITNRMELTDDHRAPKLIDALKKVIG
ncbi:serine hydrolase domain-containing protein [Aurantimicrobium sp. MWH-Uga1]|uniref:serine hydrolase domain-containing protein n=1 Tax=Aurantimicrobium sp. MWH-Uga1 TaxID=2079575 RepID=UPI000DEDB642|nr:serine hydrolase domain-containing protein [Aurantimicrobium sp. MWH-Uga1]AXE55234.1 D-alanyl-D-alanine carboxypeptidase precursor [Aurantimicrobium sp. MWH-Uga1]